MIPHHIGPRRPRQNSEAQSVDPAPDLPVQSLERVGAVQLDAVPGRENLTKRERGPRFRSSTTPAWASRAGVGRQPAAVNGGRLSVRLEPFPGSPAVRTPLPCPVQESSDNVVDVLGEFRVLGLRHASEPHGLHELIDPPGRDTADPGLLEDRDQGLLGHPPVDSAAAEPERAASRCPAVASGRAAPTA